MVAPTAKIEGLDDAMKAMAAAFPKQNKQQASLLNAAMKSAAVQTIVVGAKLYAAASDGSGALAAAQESDDSAKRGRRSGCAATPQRQSNGAIH